jgi:hypothetical protein
MLFIYHGNVVAIDLVGAGGPLVVSAIFAVLLFRRARWGSNPRRVTQHLVFSVSLGVVAALEFALWGMLYGGISVLGQFFIFSVIFPAGALQFLLFDRGRKERVSPLKPYMVGTLGLVLSDLFRTFSGSLNVSPQIIGAGGPLDGVFLGGLFMVIPYLFAAVFYFRIWEPKEQKEKSPPPSYPTGQSRGEHETGIPRRNDAIDVNDAGEMGTHATSFASIPPRYTPFPSRWLHMFEPPRMDPIYPTGLIV